MSCLQPFLPSSDNHRDCLSVVIAIVVIMAETDGMVLVMGVTGSGKSTFINTLKPNAMPVGYGLESSKTPSRARTAAVTDTN